MKKIKSKKERLVLLDAHAILHRAYHALPDFQTSQGEPTGALYGLVTITLKVVKDLRPDYLVACFDRPEETFRRQSFAAYKAKRAKTEDALIAQLERARDVLSALGIPIYDQPGFEADDIIGTIVAQSKKEKGLEIIIATGDMDTLQLADDGLVFVYTLRRGLEDTVLYDEEAVRERFGFGPELLVDYKGLRGDPSDNIPGVRGIGEKGATELIQKFGDIDAIYEALHRNPEAFKTKVKERTARLLAEQEDEARFSKELSSIRRDAPVKFFLPTRFPQDVNYEKVERLFDELEFRSLKARVSALFSGPFSTPPVSLDHSAPELLERAKVLFWLLDSNRTNPEAADILRETKSNSLEEATEILLSALKGTKLETLYREIEEPLGPILRRAEKHGILIDTNYLRFLSEEYHQEISKLGESIWRAAGEEFNINSPKQLGIILFEKLGLRRGKVKRTALGSISTAAAELEKLKDAHPVVADILIYREYQKLLSTYIDVIPKLLDEDNRLHSHFLETGTTTGRLSSENPNLQNIPIKTELGRRIRKAFIASPACRLLSLDYSQIDLRSLAMLSRDPKLLEVFQKRGDVHTEVAHLVFGVPLGEVTKEMRRRAKVINFGIIYGMGLNALRASLGTSHEEAEEFYNAYFKRFSGVAAYLEGVKKEARERGYTETYFGRRRYFPALRSRIPFIRSAAERAASNAPIQGTTADIIKKAMVRIDKDLEQKNLKNYVHLLLQIHDELIYEVNEKSLAAVGPLLKEAMESVERGPVPLQVHLAVGNHWGEL